MTSEWWVTEPLKGGHVTLQGWVRRPEGGLWWGSLSAHGRPRSRPETSQPRLREKPSPGASPCSSKRKGAPLYSWKNRGIFAVVGTQRRGLRVCLHVRQVLTKGAQVFEPRGGRGLLIAGCKCPAGSRNGVGTPRATQGTGPLESSLENPPPRFPVPKSVLSTVSVRGWECCRAVWPRGNRAVL